MTTSRNTAAMVAPARAAECQQNRACARKNAPRHCMAESGSRWSSEDRLIFYERSRAPAHTQKMTTPHTVNHRVEPSKPTPEGCGLGGSPCSAISHGHFQSYLKIMPHGYSFPVELPVITKGSRDLANAWTWNGSTEKPTLKPSIRTIHADGKMSHVWLTDGVCQHLDDSTDGLAGQTLPLLPLPNSSVSGEVRSTGSPTKGEA